MNKLLYLSAAALFSLSVSAYAASVVDSSSPLNWSDSSTWVGGTLPSSDETITFEGNNTQLVVDQSVTASNITLSEGQSQTIDISQGSVLALSSLTGTGESSLLTVTGSGKLTSLSTATNANVHFNMSGGTLENPTTVWLGAMEGATSQTNSMKLVFTGHYTGARANGFFNSTFILDENSSYKVGSGHWNMWGDGAKFITKSGSKFIMTSTGGFNCAKAVMDVAGNITVAGKYDLDQGQSYTMNWSNATFRAGASINQTATAASVNPTGNYLDWRNVLIRSGTTTIESGVEKNALNFQSIIYFGVDTTLVLNSSDVFKSGVLQSKNGAIVQQEQGKTTFYLQDRVWVGNSRYQYGASNFTLVNNADNNIGAFAFWTDSTLTLKLDGKSKLAINDLQHMEGASGYIQVFIENLGRDKLFFGDLVFENPDVYFYDPDTLDLLEEGVDYELVSGVYNGVSGKWMNAIAVPEPSTFAAIFGVVALAVILRRRRG